MEDDIGEREREVQRVDNCIKFLYYYTNDIIRYVVKSKKFKFKFNRNNDLIILITVFCCAVVVGVECTSLSFSGHCSGCVNKCSVYFFSFYKLL